MRDNNRRTKRLLLLVIVVAWLGSKVLWRYGSSPSLPQDVRGLLFIGGLIVLLLPIGFLYGRNAMRRDAIAKIGRVLAYAAPVAICLGSFLGGAWTAIGGLSAGYLLGFAGGQLAARRGVAKYGDSIEADEFLNVAPSERIPAPQPACEAYLKGLDRHTRRRVWTLRLLEPLTVLAALGLSLWIVWAEYLDALARLIHVRQGDGTRFFITTDSLVVAVPMILISLVVCGIALQLLLPALAGTAREHWLEFVRLRDTSPAAAARARLNRIIVYVSIPLSIVALVLFFDSYVKVADSGIAVNEFWGIGARFYEWHDIRDVEAGEVDYICKSGHQHQRFEGRIVFSDGTEWRPDTSFARRAPMIEQAVRFAAQQNR